MRSDRRALYATAFVRALATGLIGVLLGFYLADRRLDASAIGAVVGAGLAGATAATLVVAFLGDRIGRRRCLITLSLLAAAGGAALAASDSPWVLGAAAFLGMVNGMGQDRGASLVLEQAVLPSTVTPDRRTFSFAVYNVLQDAGHAVGALLAGAPALLAGAGAPPAVSSSRSAVLLYAALVLLPCALYARLSPAVEPTPSERRVPASPATRRLLWRICSLFALDSLGGGFLTTALLAYFFHQRFGVSAAVVGPLFFGARVANALSHFAASWLARRIGLVNTMVFTHIPSSVLLLTVAYAPSFPVAAALFLLREGLAEMDVPTRQSYVMAVVRPEERTLASGVTHLVRLGAWTVGPAVAGLFMERVSLLTPLLIAAAMKIVYDVLLWRAFRHVRPPEEAAVRA
jgi:MFS family permease